MPDSEDIKLPTQPGAPTSEHGQIMFAMGKMLGRLDAIDNKQAIANGRTAKLEDRMTKVETQQNTDTGEKTGKDAVWKLLYALVGLVIGGLGVYLALHH